MAKIKLGFEEAYQGDVPPLCMRCGKPTTQKQKKMFSTGPLGLPFLVVPLPGVTVYSYSGKVWVNAPLCESHRHHWLWRTLTIFFTFAALLIFGITAGAFALDPPEWLARGMAGSLCLGFFVALPVWIVIALLLRFTGIRLAKVGKTTITLAGISSEFAQALEKKQQGKEFGRK